MKHNAWILIANSAEAKIYSTYKAKLLQSDINEHDIKLIEHLSHPNSRKQDSELMSDNLGRYRSSLYGSDTYDPAHDPHQLEEERFAMKLISAIDDSFKHHQFEELFLVASPVFMGMLNKHLEKHNGLKITVVQTIEKDYVGLNERELVQRLSSHL